MGCRLIAVFRKSNTEFFPVDGSWIDFMNSEELRNVQELWIFRVIIWVVTLEWQPSDPVPGCHLDTLHVDAAVVISIHQRLSLVN